jgi:membrane fusion protein (multidrug efflux system)
MPATRSQSVAATAYAAVGSRYGSRIRDLIAELRADKARLRKVLMIGGVVLVAAIGSATWLMGGRYVSTDDAYIHAAKLMVSTDVSGLVKEVHVHEGQRVKKGEVLFRIDPTQFNIQLADAKAALAQTELDVDSMRADYQRMLQNIEAQQSQVELNRTTYGRFAALVKANAVSKTQYDQARLTLASSQSTLDSLREAAKVQLAKLNGNPNLPAHQAPAYLKAKAAVDEVERQISHTVVRAPFDGIVSQVDSLQPGTLLISAMSAFSTTSAVGLVSTNDVWIEANLKETDLTHVKDGAPVSVTVDTYPGRTWTGHVASVGAASDTAFSALPNQNAGGNWVKVVQRIPVRVKLDIKDGDPPLRAGMSTITTIDTGNRRWSRFLFGD